MAHHRPTSAHSQQAAGENEFYGPQLPDFTTVMDACRGPLRHRLSELISMEQLCRQAGDLISTRTEALVKVDDFTLPLISLTIGNPSTAKHCLMLTGGIHGVERIGTQVLLAWLETVVERCRWDSHWRAQFTSDIAIVAVPIANPGGMLKDSRCNPNGVDLNRHAPIDAEDKVPFLVGGQRMSKRLSWYRGKRGADYEIEFIALQNIINRYCHPSRPSIVVDFHSGFGFQDHIWIPYAYRRQPIDDIGSYVALKLLWERNFPHHNYVFGPQAMHYLSHGDIWDYFYRQCRAKGITLLPLTLEMGSWLWVKKHPQQLFSFAGLFNPTVPHRHSRVLRGHLLLIDFLLAATRNMAHWQPKGEQERGMQQMAQSLWYRQL
ncbi:Uncharacterised protein [Zhongshania aliphaticivorans]|uniref:Peptidase M14 domain-containing protein n=1 Tax=Zhongshania aliphaticivorans TaxID=1470434 RepID=A0A5S9Q600_9GAMM|nr:DUF2817 domain-containing protein [Zhongshania aliphaticivorans]CAA0095058.1 Uncharacterised protein [Zhongshania aliphaticivorans]CAA0112837.1 Uncharacterised protein [Zhongshania aliphaticivorans]